MFVLNSDISIGNFHFSGVHEVFITHSIHSYADTAVIKLPSVCRIMKNGKAVPGELITGYQFKDGDAVIIKLGYNGNMNEEFRGFVKQRNINMPLEVECEGYSWQLKRNNVNGYWQQIPISDLLKKACEGTDISVNVSDDISLQNISVNNLTGAQVIDMIKKVCDVNLSVFFISPAKLWCGIVNTPVSQGKDVFGLGTVSYKLGYNVIKDNDLQQRSLNDDPLRVSYVNKSGGGQVLNESSDPLIKELRTYRKFLNHIATASDLKTLADEKQNRENYIGYEGRIHAFLQPYATPGYIANVSDSRYNQANGQYLIESTQVIYGTNGARRIVEIGPGIGFANSAL